LRRPDVSRGDLVPLSHVSRTRPFPSYGIDEPERVEEEGGAFRLKREEHRHTMHDGREACNRSARARLRPLGRDLSDGRAT
jgi:hypothetical protein